MPKLLRAHLCHAGGDAGEEVAGAGRALHRDPLQVARQGGRVGGPAAAVGGAVVGLGVGGAPVRTAAAKDN